MTTFTKTIGMILGIALLSSASLYAAEATVGADIASAYVFRGVTFNDGLVVQPYVDVAGLPIAVGVWANFDVDDYDGAANDGQFSEIDLYASYDLPLEGPVGLSLGYCEYTYPGSGGDPVVDEEGGASSTFGESDRELSLSASLDTILAPSVGVYYGIDGGIEKTTYVEASIGHSLALSDEVGLDLGAGVGYVSPDEGDDGFSHYTASATLSYAFVSAGVTYVGQIDDDVLPDGPGAYDVEVIGTLGISTDF